MSRRQSRGIKQIVDRAGLGAPARRVRDRLRAGRPPSWAQLQAQRDDEHMRLLFAFLLAPDSNCIDVGAGLGDVLAEITRVAPQGRHIAYEPLPQSHAAVQARFPGVDVRRAALSNVDGEGAQQLVIEGAMQTIATHRPVVVFEHGEDSASGYGTTSDDIYRLLCDQAGLRIFDLDGNGPFDREAFRAARVWNFVAHR